jgi:hypothetical protein
MSKMTPQEAGRLGGIVGGQKTKQIWTKKYQENPKQCKNCKGELPYEKRHNTFCDSSCAASFNNAGLARNLASGKYREKQCQWCEEHTANEKYCSSGCHRAHSWSLLKEQMETTGLARAVGTAKRYLREVRGNGCELCGRLTWKGESIPLVLDHISGNAEDWRLKNLRLICPNCDAMTPTYKGRNKGNGRHARRQRYRDGKSY